MDEEEQVALVQDCPDIIRVMLRLLKKHGYKVTLEELQPLKLIVGGKNNQEE